MQPAAAEVKWHILNLSDMSDDGGVFFFFFFFFWMGSNSVFFSPSSSFLLFDIFLMTDEQNSLDKQTQIEYDSHTRAYFLRCVPHLSVVLADFLLYTN